MTGIAAGFTFGIALKCIEQQWQEPDDDLSPERRNGTSAPSKTDSLNKRLQERNKEAHTKKQLQTSKSTAAAQDTFKSTAEQDGESDDEEETKKLIKTDGDERTSFNRRCCFLRRKRTTCGIILLV